MTDFKIGDRVRLLEFPEDSWDAYATVQFVHDDGSIWVSNLNMPFMGTTSKIYSADEAQNKVIKR